MISIIGIPLDENSSFLRGSAKAPPLILDAFRSDASNMYAENGFNCGDSGKVKNLGNLQLTAGKAAMDSIQKAVSKELNRNQKVVSLGGDHSITFPIIQAYSQSFPDLNILHIDAHPDLYDNFENNPYSHASPFARIMEKGLVNRLVQVGIRTLNDHQKEQIKRFGLEVIEMKDFDPEKIQPLLSAMTGGMAVALYTTLSGLVTSTILKFQYFLLDSSLSKLINSLTSKDLD